MTRGKLRTSDHLRIVPHVSGNYVAYHSLYGGLCVIDTNLKHLLDNCRIANFANDIVRKYPKRVQKEVLKFLQMFTEKSFLVKADSNERIDYDIKNAKIIESISTGSRIAVVQLILTDSCNFNCSYCFVDKLSIRDVRDPLVDKNSASLMKPNNAVNFLKEVIRIIIENRNTSLYIQFFGGEPFINWGTLRHVIEFFGEGDKYGISIKYSVVTNGSLIDVDIARTLRKYNVDVIVSYDSSKGTNRRFADGKPANDRILAGVKTLKNAGNNVVFNSVLGRTTYEDFDHDIIHNAIASRIFEIGVLLDLDQKFYQEYSAEEIIERLWNVYSYGSKKGVTVTGYWHMIFQQMFAFKWCYQRLFKTCSAAGCQLSIQPSGSVFPCKASSTCYGSIEDISKILTSSKYKQYASKGVVSLAECLGCDIEGFCSGFCLGPLEAKYGDINVIEKSTCAVYRGITKMLISNIHPDDATSYSMTFEGWGGCP